VNRSRPGLFLVLLVWGLSSALPAADPPSAAKVGAIFERRLESREAQSVIEHWTGKRRLAWSSALTARVRFRLMKLDERRVVVRGEVLEGRFEIRRQGFLELEEVYGLFLDSLVFELTLTSRRTRLQVEARSWKPVVARFEESQRQRRLTDVLRAEVLDGLRRHLERAQVVSFWPLLRGDDEPTGLRGTLDLSLWRKHGRTSGTIHLEPLRKLACFFSDTLGEQIPLRRSHTPLGAKRAQGIGGGTLAWLLGADGLPAACRLEATGDYVDHQELAELVESPSDYRQNHEIEIGLAAPGVPVPGLRRLTGLPPRPGPPDLLLLLELASERRELVDRRRRAARGGRDLVRAIEEYAELERVRHASPRLRAALHFALAEELALAAFGERRGGVDDLEPVVEEWIREADDLPVLLVALRAVAHPFARLPAPDRVRLCEVALGRGDPRLARWGSRVLAQGNWKGSAAALIGALGRQLDRGVNASAELVRELRTDLQRLLGPSVRTLDPAGLTLLAGVRPGLERGRPFTFTGRLEDPRGVTYFEEAMSGPTIFLIDVSVDVSRGAQSRRGGALEVLPRRLAWARRFIGRTSRKLKAADRLGLVKFHGRASVFAQGLRPADASTRKGAVAFLSRVERVRPEERDMVRRARYDVGFSAALEQSDVETIVLLTDGARGDFWRVEAELLVSNYLRGVRIVTYGHGERNPVVDEDPLRFLERLAYTHHGWCRFVE